MRERLGFGTFQAGEVAHVDHVDAHRAQLRFEGATRVRRRVRELSCAGKSLHHSHEGGVERELSDIDRPYVTLIEAARKQPTISVLWRLAVAIDLTPQDFAKRIERFNVELQRVSHGSSTR